MVWILILVAVFAGSLIPVQAGINASLRTAVSSPIFAALTNFTVGGLLLAAYLLVSRAELPPLHVLQKAPWWCWLGGAMGAFLVMTGVLTAHRLGAATFIACIIVGQLSASVVLDHFGWVGYAEHPVSLARVAGVGLLAAGAYLIRTH